MRSTIITSTTIAAKGTVNTENVTFTIAANDQIIDPEPFNDVIIAYRNGGPIRVRDVGQAVAAASDRTVAAYQNGRPGILLIVYKQPGANVIETVDQIKEALPRLTQNTTPRLPSRAAFLSLLGLLSGDDATGGDDVGWGSSTVSDGRRVILPFPFAKASYHDCS